MGRRLAVGLTAAALACSGLAVMAEPAGATTYTVTSGLDDGSAGTFRWAVAQAGLNVGDDVVTISPSVTAITLDDCVTGRVAIAPTGLLTIEGNGATVTQTCDGDGVLGGIGDTTIEDLTLTGGDATDEGGGIRLNGGLTLDGVTVTANAADGGGGGIFATTLSLTDTNVTDNRTDGDGGGIAIAGTTALTITKSTISGNVGDTGGGIFSGGPVVISQSTVKENESSVGGGVATEGDATLTTSDVTANTADTVAGGIAAQGNVTITDSTVSGNEATVGFGGVYGLGVVSIEGSTVADNVSGTNGVGGVLGGDVAVTRSAITGNKGGGAYALDTMAIHTSTVSENTGSQVAGIFAVTSIDLSYATVVGNGSSANVVTPGTLTSFGSVIAFGGATCDFLGAGTTVSNGYNFSGDASCGFTQATDIQNGGDPIISSAGLHDGTTANHVPGSGSALLNKIPAGDARCTGTDQRGFARPANGGCDIGSVEVRTVSAIPTSLTTPYQTPVLLDLVPLVTDPDGVLSEYEVDGALFGMLDAAEGGVVTYTPDPGFSGADSYTYIVCSEGNVICTSTQNVSITVGAGPVAAVPVSVTPQFTG